MAVKLCPCMLHIPPCTSHSVDVLPCSPSCTIHICSPCINALRALLYGTINPCLVSSTWLELARPLPHTHHTITGV